MNNANTDRFDLLDFLNNGGQYLISSKYLTSDETDPFIPLLEKNKEEYYIIVPNHSLLFRSGIEKLFSTYYLHEMFDLGSCFKGHYGEPFSFWHISKTKPEKIKISILYADAHPDEDKHARKNYALLRPAQYTNSFDEYCKAINMWMNWEGSIPKGVPHKYDFNVIDISDFNPRIPSVKYYRKDNEDLRKLLNSTDIVCLRDVADVKTSMPIIDGPLEKVKLLNTQNRPKYPLDPDRDTQIYIKTSVLLQKGDIISCNRGKDYYLMTTEPPFDLYAFGTVIRPKHILPEYLYLYLTSNAAKRIQDEFVVSVGSGSTNFYDTSFEEYMQSGEMAGFPVVKPRRSEKYYREEFLKIIDPDHNHYPSFVDMTLVSMEDVLDEELIKKICFNNAAVVRKQVLEDLEEVNACFNSKAYKATLILCGSILEAVLIDWLSEIDGVDYFTKEYQVTKTVWDKKRNCEKVIRKEGKLSDYISRIKEIKKPEWMQESEAAEKIRNKRNLVHAKLCLKSKENIDETLCKEVIQYLEIVLKSRGIDNHSTNKT